MNAALLGTCIGLLIVQFLAFVPWASIIGLLARGEVRRQNFWMFGLGISAVLGLLLGFYLNSNNDPKVLANWGRFYFSVLHLQLGMDFFVAAFLFLLRFWPKGGAVALAAFQEGLRQPKYWLLLVAGTLLMAVSTIIPFFTFGEDIKVVKELCFVCTMLMPGIFGLLAASISVSDVTLKAAPP